MKIKKILAISILAILLLCCGISTVSAKNIEKDTIKNEECLVIGFIKWDYEKTDDYFNFTLAKGWLKDKDGAYRITDSINFSFDLYEFVYQGKIFFSPIFSFDFFIGMFKTSDFL